MFAIIVSEQLMTIYSSKGDISMSNLIAYYMMLITVACSKTSKGARTLHCREAYKNRDVGHHNTDFYCNQGCCVTFSR